MLLIHEAAVRTWLLADATIAGYVGTRVYIKSAATGATYPYLLISHNAGQDPNREAAQSIDTILNIQAVADGANGSTAALIANAVHERLDGETLTLNGPYTMRHGAEFQSAYDLTDIEDGKRFYYAGGLYRFESDRN